jgi:tRNA (guanine-N7-)-methyltransferase
MYLSKKGIEIINPDYSVFSIGDFGVVELDIGCGKGNFSVGLAKRFPERLVVAFDIMPGRLGNLAKRAERENISNLRILRTDGMLMLGRILPDSSVDRIHLVCPDPWPKGKHRCHRLVSSEFCGMLLRVLKGGGIFHFASDDDAYCLSVKKIIGMNCDFRKISSDENEISEIKSDFEMVWLSQGRVVQHLFFEKQKKAN